MPTQDPVAQSWFSEQSHAALASRVPTSLVSTSLLPASPLVWCCSSVHKSLPPADPMGHNLVPSKICQSTPQPHPSLTKKHFILNPADSRWCHSAVHSVHPPGSLGSLVFRLVWQIDMPLRGGLDGEDHSPCFTCLALGGWHHTLPGIPGSSESVPTFPTVQRSLPPQETLAMSSPSYVQALMLMNRHPL